jgi:hypothetical protein
MPPILEAITILPKCKHQEGSEHIVVTIEGITIALADSIKFFKSAPLLKPVNSIKEFFSCLPFLSILLLLAVASNF